MTKRSLTDWTVLVAGGAGFIGSHLSDALVVDNRVRVLNKFSTGQRSNVPAAATFIQSDIRNSQTLAEAMAGVDLIFHKAGLVSVTKSVIHPKQSHAVNVDTTVELLDRARTEDTRVAFASSAAIYDRTKTDPIAGDVLKEPTSPYGIDKLATDYYVRAFAELYDLPTVCLRYFNVYGSRQTARDYSGVVSTFLDRARFAELLSIAGDRSQTRDFVHISDVIRANLAAAVTDLVGKAYNIGTGTATTICELASTVKRTAELDTKIVYTDPRPGDIRHSRADIERARAALGYDPTVSLSDRIAAPVNDGPTSLIRDR